jgi:hypothetical protein
MGVFDYIFLWAGLGFMGLVFLYLAARLVASAVLRTIEQFRKDR